MISVHASLADGRRSSFGSSKDGAVELERVTRELANHWSTTSNNAAFGTDYFARTAVAKSNILVNAPAETKYLYQDLDATGAVLVTLSWTVATFDTSAPSLALKLNWSLPKNPLSGW